jgi:hypothetical protein
MEICLNPNFLYLFYLVAGAGGTACRLALSPTLQFGFNRRTRVELIVGGVSGAVIGHFIPILGGLFGLSPETVAGVPPFIKGCLVFAASYAGSFTIGEFLSRKKPNGVPAKPGG